MFGVVQANGHQIPVNQVRRPPITRALGGKQVIIPLERHDHRIRRLAADAPVRPETIVEVERVAVGAVRFDLLRRHDRTGGPDWDGGAKQHGRGCDSLHDFKSHLDESLVVFGWAVWIVTGPNRPEENE